MNFKATPKIICVLILIDDLIGEKLRTHNNNKKECNIVSTLESVKTVKHG
jgi:hypothetical protein